MSLFAPDAQSIPLAARMRPTTLEQYVGQSHLMGPDKPLRRMIEAGHCHSMILWGPPGTGKTTLATLIASYVDAHVITLSAVTSGVKDIRSAVEQAKNNEMTQHKTMLFVDEVHRFNKSQQDAFLPFVEDGTIIFIGATTENPSFALNNALLSRTRTYVLKSLNDDELKICINQALANDELLSPRALTISDEALQVLVRVAAGDARKALLTLELATDFIDDTEIDSDAVVQASGEKMAAYDQKGDDYYDLISAFHKSVRGSDPDAALYWYARILVGGGDPLYVARRLLAIVTEDIGTADPKSMQIALNAWDIFHRVGPAEGERAIAEAVVYCALAPKSNAVYTAFKQALALAKQTGTSSVPNHLRNAPTQLMQDLEFGKGYRYAHDEPYAYAAGEQYFPDDIDSELHTLYQPNERGFEKQLLAKIAFLRELDKKEGPR